MEGNVGHPYSHIELRAACFTSSMSNGYLYLGRLEETDRRPLEVITGLYHRHHHWQSIGLTQYCHVPKSNSRNEVTKEQWGARKGGHLFPLLEVVQRVLLIGGIVGRHPVIVRQQPPLLL
jgi:hypothetical protein